MKTIKECFQQAARAFGCAATEWLTVMAEDPLSEQRKAAHEVVILMEEASSVLEDLGLDVAIDLPRTEELEKATEALQNASAVITKFWSPPLSSCSCSRARTETLAAMVAAYNALAQLSPLCSDPATETE